MRWRWGLVVAACVAHASMARAEHVVDPQTDFAIDLDAQEDRMCVLIPAKRGNCKGLDPDALRARYYSKSDPQQFVFAAVVRVGAWRYVAQLSRFPAVPEVEEEDVVAAASAFDGGVVDAGWAMSLSLMQRTTPHVSRVNGVQLVDFSMRSEVSTDAGMANMHTAVRLLFGRQAFYDFEFTVENSHAPEVDNLMARTLTTLKLEPVPPAPPAPRSSLSIAHGVLILIAALAGIVWGASWWRARTTLKTSPPKTRRARPTRRFLSTQRIAATLCGVASIGAHLARAFAPGHFPLSWQLVDSIVGVAGIVATVYGIRGRLGPDAAKPKPTASP